MCAFGSEYFDSYAFRVAKYHKHDPHFLVFCEVDNFGFTTISWSSFKCHMSRKHKILQNENCPGAEVEENEHNDEDDLGDALEIPTKQQSRDFRCASFLLQLET